MNSVDDIDIVNGSGELPLHESVRSGNIQVFKLLWGNGFRNGCLEREKKRATEKRGRNLFYKIIESVKEIASQHRFFSFMLTWFKVHPVEGARSPDPVRGVGRGWTFPN